MKNQRDEKIRESGEWQPKFLVEKKKNKVVN